MNKIYVLSIFDSSKKFSISLMCDYDLENAKMSISSYCVEALKKACVLNDDDLFKCVSSINSIQLLHIGFFDPLSNQLEALDKKEILVDYSQFDIKDFIVLFERELPKNIYNKIYEVVKK